MSSTCESLPAQPENEAAPAAPCEEKKLPMCTQQSWQNHVVRRDMVKVDSSDCLCIESGQVV